jgi:hypothetical protein
MTLIPLQLKAQDNTSPKFGEKLETLKALLYDLESRDLPSETVNYINSEITALNSQQRTDPKLHKQLSSHQSRILKHLEKELKLTPKGYYKRLWMVLGMSAFGLPLGIVFGASMGNTGLLGIGLPIGMVIGIAVGASMDTKAAKEGRQLNV